MGDALRQQFPGVEVEGSTGAWIVPVAQAESVARALRNQHGWDQLSNVTGVDFLTTAAQSEGEVGYDGFFEVTYHLYSVRNRKGPLILKQRSLGRENPVVTSLTPVWRSAEFQEREVFDLFGVRFEGHPDLRRILMWDEFQDHPMRKDYREPDDYEYEPTAHGEILEKAKRQAESEATSAVVPSPPHVFAVDAAKEGIGESSDGESQVLEISLGPQHPSTHGVFRMQVALQGETIVRLKPVFGYLHRNHEKIAEKSTYVGMIPYTDRLDYFCSLTNNWAYVHTVERLAGIAVSERAEYLRVILAELTRLVNHSALIGFFLNDLGALGTPLLYALRERERILDLFEELTGARMMCNYLRFGGCRCEPPEGWVDKAKKVVADFPKFLDEMETLLVTNEIVMARTQGIGILSPEKAIQAGVTGPMLRASGVNHDLRKVDAYGVYGRMEFRIPLGNHGDCYDRMMIRFLEMRESLKILDQALRDLPGGSVLSSVKIRNFKPPAGERYGRIESPKGELGFHLISDGSPHPYRFHVRAPSFVNLTILEDLCLGHKIADAVIILGSIDIVLGEVDR